MTDEQQEQQAENGSGPSGRRQVRWTPLLIVIAWAIILYIGDAELLQRLLPATTVSYNYSGAVRNHGYALSIALGALGLATYITPVILGALARTWPGALGFALVPMWLALIPAIATSFAGAVPSPLIYPQGPVQLGPLIAPVWLDSSRALSFVLASALFAILGTIGWVGRRAWTHELFPAR